MSKKANQNREKKNRDLRPARGAQKSSTRFYLTLSSCSIILLVIVAIGWRQHQSANQDVLQAASDTAGERPADLASINLSCAQGLPGAEALDITFVHQTLDGWTARVKSETSRHLYRVKDPQYSARYQNSQSRYRVEMLVQVLQEDLGVHYNLERVTRIDFKNSKDLFLHGLVADENGGTCVSMPVLYAAVGRRLGYPIKLVEAKSHLFCRWEDANERFNFDAAGNDGVAFNEDEYYRSWPKPITQKEVDRGEFLRTLSADEERAVFLAARGHCLIDNGRLHEAQVAYAQAHQLNPRSQDYLRFLADSVARETVGREMPLAQQASPPTPAPALNTIDIEAINRANRQDYDPQLSVPDAAR